MIAKDPYTDQQEREFLAWIRTLPSCLSSRRPCEACHILSVAHGSGKAIKPKLMAVPMTQDEHHLQTVKGYRDAIVRYAPQVLLSNDHKAAINWFIDKALWYRKRFLAEIWLKNSLYSSQNEHFFL